MTSKLPIAAVALATALVFAGASYASDAEDEAAKHYVAGRKLLESGQFRAAVGELKASLALVSSPNSELLLAHAEREQGHHVEALTAYDHVVTEAGERVRAGEARYHATLEEAGRWAAVLRAELCEIDITLAHAPDKTTVEVDDKKIDLPAPAADPRQLRIFHEPGPARVVVRAGDGHVLTKSLTLAAGQTGALTFDLGPAPVSAPIAPTATAAPKPPSSSPPPEGRRGPPLPTWIAFGAGVVGVGVFGVFGGLASSKASELRQCAPCPASKQSVADAGKSEQLIANVALVAAGVSVAAGAVLWIALPSAKKANAALGVSPAGIALRQSF